MGRPSGIVFSSLLWRRAALSFVPVAIIGNLVDGKTRITVVDPRFSKLASKAHRYLPVNPGEDGAFFEGILQWIIKDGRYDGRYLSCANKGAAKAAGETTWTNAALLVKLDKDGGPGKFLRAREIGLAQPEKRKDKEGKEDGFGPGHDFTRPDDFYIRMVANVATDGSPVPDAEDAELKLFLESRKHLPATVFDPARWEKIAGANWRKVVYLLNRGGRFQEYGDIYKGDHVANQYKSMINMYQEKTAVTNYWLLAVYPENHLIVNPVDAKKLGLKDGDVAKVVSATNKEGVYDLGNGKKKEMAGKVKVSETIMPGAVTFTLCHGHWATGAADVTIDGKVVKGDSKRGTGSTRTQPCGSIRT